MRSLVLLMAAAASTVGAEAQVRARVTLDSDRVYTGELTIDEDGELVLDSDLVGGPAVLDFPRAKRIEILETDPDPDLAAVDVLTVVGNERYLGEVTSILEGFVTFKTTRFGEVTIPRELVGDLVPRAGATPGPEGDGEAAPGDEPAAEAAGPWSDWSGFDGEARINGTVAELDERGARIERAGDLTGHRISIDVEWLGRPEFSVELGGLTLQAWDGVPVLFSRDGESIELSMGAEPLEPDTGAIVELRVDGAERVVVDFIEPHGAQPIKLGLELPLKAAPDSLAIESLGRGIDVALVDIRDPDSLLGADGLVRLGRPLRGAEVTGFDPAERILETTLGRAGLDGSKGINFLPRDRRDELQAPRSEAGQGFFRTRGGESIAVRQVIFERGRFIVRTPYADGPVEIPFEDFRSVRMPKKRRARGGVDFRMSFDGGSQMTAGFLGIDRTEEGFDVLRTEPGFKTPVRGSASGQIWIERASRSLFHASRRLYPHDVLLADGQSFPAKIEAVDERSITFATPFSDESVTLKHTQVKALMFEPRKADFLLSEITVQKKPKADDRNRNVRIAFGNAQVKPVDKSLVTEDKLQRALLVPRSQKSDPGTHLLLARNGDLMRCNVVGLEDHDLLVDGGAGGQMSIPGDVLAAVIHVAPKAEGEVDPREARIKTRRATDRWTCNLGPRATLIGSLETGEAEGSLVLTHPYLGRVNIAPDEFKRLDFGRGFAPKFRKLLDWATAPMPEPSISGG